MIYQVQIKVMPLKDLLDPQGKAVLGGLANLGITEVKDVRKYLNQFLMDGRVIDIPYIVRALLVRGIIVPFRAPKSAEASIIESGSFSIPA